MFRRAGTPVRMAGWLAKVSTEAGEEGRASTQIPHHCYWMGAVPTPPTPDYLSHLKATKRVEDIIGEGFHEGYCVWLTNKGPITNKECKNPLTKRQLSGSLYIAPELVNTYYSVFFDMYVALGHPRGLKTLLEFNKQIADTYRYCGKVSLSIPV